MIPFKDLQVLLRYNVPLLHQADNIKQIDKASNIFWIVNNYPEYNFLCDWSVLTSLHWRDLLYKHPYLSEHCNWDAISGFDWVYVLIKNPQFAEHCYWDKLSTHDWRYLLSQFKPNDKTFEPYFIKHYHHNPVK